MSDAADAVPLPYKWRETARIRRRREDIWVGVSGLVAALLTLPLAPSSWHGPEVAATLAVAAIALLAGQRWAIAVIVLSELLLIPTSWPRAFLADNELPVRLAALGSLALIVPGILAMRRAAAALVVVTGLSRTRATCRRFQVALLLAGTIAASLPLF